MASVRSHSSRGSHAGVRLAEVDELELEIEKLVAGGDGLGRFEGIPIFVPRSAPGDRVKVRLVERRPDYGRAEIITVERPGPGRREPPCPHFERCGGCDLQHLEDHLQLELKTAAACETLERLGGVDLSQPPQVISGSPWAYRLRTQLQVRHEGARAQVGYFERASREFVEVSRCPVLVGELEELLPTLSGPLSAASLSRFDVAAGDGAAVSGSPPVAGLPQGELHLTVAELRFAFDARCFFQVNRELLPELVSSAVGDWGGESAYDLYAGVGLFSLPLAQKYERVVAVEGDRVAARFARKNARENRLHNLEVLTQVVESWVGQLSPGTARVIVDPPRAGLSRRVARTLAERRPQRLTYVSCHPAALARDLKRLETSYEIESLTLIDLFPQTGHMEVIAQLVARD